MAEIVANIIRLRACQAAVVALIAAAYVTVGDVKSLIVGREPVSTSYYPPLPLITGHGVAYVTSPPALIPSTWSTDPVGALFETKTLLRDLPSGISLTRNMPTAGLPRLIAPTSYRPQIAIKTSSTISFPLPATPTPLSHRDSTASGDDNDGDSTHLPLPQQHWIPDSVRAVFSGVKESVRVMMAESLNFVKVNLASSTMAKDRKIWQLDRQIIEFADLTNRAANIAQAAQNENSRAATEIAQLRSTAEQRERAFTKQQWAWKEKLEEAAEDTARSLEEKDAELEMEMEKASEALQKAKDQAKDDATREARHLTDLATQQHAEFAQQRKADEATINALRDQSAADANTIRELSNQLSSIARMDEKVASLVTESETLMKKVTDLRQEQARIVQSGADAEAALKATIGKLSAKLELANMRAQAAEAEASYQEALAAQAREEQRVAEERAEKLEAQAAKAKAMKKAAEEEASREKARMEVKKAQEAWQAQKELKKLYQQAPTCSEVRTPKSDLSSKESSMLPLPQPAVRLPTNVVVQKDVCAAQNELVPWHDRPGPAKTEGKEPPEERELLANTPTGPEAERWEEENEE